jgi:hypothetical protein
LDSLAGAAIAWWTGVQANRWNRTLELHREFNTEAISKSRTAAWAFIRGHSGKTFKQIAEDPTLDTAALPLWDVMRFYQRLAIVTKHRQVVRKQIPDLFGEIFVWWHEISFRTMLAPTGWVAWKDINWLYEWMKKEVGSNDPNSAWCKWHNQASGDMTSHAGSSVTPPKALKPVTEEVQRESDAAIGGSGVQGER